MDAQTNRFGPVDPVVTPRACGGWIAVAPSGAKLRIAVVGESEIEARERFRQSVERWRANLQFDR